MKTPELTDHEALFRLFGAATDGTITEQEATTLQQALAASAATRKLWFLHQDLELGLEEWAAARTLDTAGRITQATAALPPQAPPAFNITPITPRPRRAFPTATLAIAAALTAAIGLSLWFTASRQPQPVATLTRSATAHWQSAPLSSGAPILSLQELNLRSGTVELAMSSGARLVFEGPGRMAVLSQNSVKLDSGRLHAHVPPSAKGFSINGPGFSLIDHGTRFGCSVNHQSPPEVHVFTGLVEVRPDRQAPAMLQQNEAIAIHPDSTEEIAARPELFVSSEDLETWNSSPAARAEHAGNMLKNHPAARVYFNASTLDGDQLANQAAAAPPPHRAAITTRHCTLTDGRLPNRPAILMDGRSSRIDIAPIYRSHQSITLVAWIRTDTAARRQNLLCGSGDFLPGEPAWYLYYHNALGFGAHSPVSGLPGRGWRSLHSTPPPAPLDHWSMVATVVDGRTRTITHFLNGQVLGMGQASLPPAIRLGPLTVGAPREENPSQTHHFLGAIDEFALIAAPLTAQDILRIYQFGSSPSR